LTYVLDGAVSGATTLTFAGILAGAGVLLLGLLHFDLILLGAVSGATTRTFAGILAGARMFRRCLGGVALGARRIGVNGDAFKRPMVPPSKPVKAAARIREFFRLMMLHSPFV
jgi:hypothetical protein